MTTATAEEAIIGGKSAPAPADPRRAAEVIAPVAASAARTAQLPAYRRAEVLLKTSEAIAREREAFAALICEEVQKPLKTARQEVDRAIFTFRFASEEAKRFGGEWLPIDFDANTEGRIAIVRRVPRGPCLFIAPFN